MTKLIRSHGELVLKGEIAVSAFLRAVMAKAESARRWSGTLEELETLVKNHMDSWEPGTGSVAGDVRLVNVPTEGFFTNIVPITAENAEKIVTVWEPRVEGEMPYAKNVIISDELIPAAVVKIVIYRADVLAQDSDRSSDAEWEIVAVLAQPSENVPMDPVAMARNALRLPGGTYREYDNATWAEAVDFWSKHVYLTPAKPEASF